jgi:hypothetical protein
MFYEYRIPQAGEHTVIAADPAEGGDFSAAVAKSQKHHDTFALFHARMESAQFGYELYKMAQHIKRTTNQWPLIAVERNLGMATIAILNQLNYPNLYRMKAMAVQYQSGEENKIGWVTTQPSRQKMLDELLVSVRQRLNVIPSHLVISEMESFVYHETTGKPQAAEGSNDDLIMAEAIAWQVLNASPSSAGLESLIHQFPDVKVDAYGIPA